jgi:hypothetical protein
MIDEDAKFSGEETSSRSESAQGNGVVEPNKSRDESTMGTRRKQIDLRSLPPELKRFVSSMREVRRKAV